MHERGRERKGEQKGLRRAICALCLLTLVLSVLPLYLMTGYNHPYYDDFGFSAVPHQVWKETGDLGAALKAALENAARTRYTWQGTYTGTLLSNLQPGTFSEELYWISGCFLLTAFLGCFWFFFATVFGRRGLGLKRWETTVVSALTLTVMLQFMPDMGEAFYWFNGGVGNVFIYSLIALSAALFLRLYRTESRGGAVGLTLGLILCMAALGGGSYSGGLFSLCALACVIAWMFVKRRPRRWVFLLCFGVLAAGFVYSMSAPGNMVRAGMIGYSCSPVKAIARSLYEGAILMTGYVRFPLLGLTVLVSPLLWRAAKESPYRFRHPLWMIALSAALFCTQLTPPLYSIASIGDGRIQDTYWLCFVVLWLLWVYLLLGFAARKWPEAKPERFGRAVVIAGLCLSLSGCLGCRYPGDTLYGIQNMTGVSAWQSLLNGEAAQYDREMTERERLLNDESQPVVTLAPLSAVPRIFMEDELTPNAVYDVRPSLCQYYGKEAIRLAGEEEAP